MVVTDNNCASPITVNPVAEIKVHNEFTAATASSDHTYCMGEEATALTLTVDGSGSYGYQWYGNGAAIEGATGATYTPSTATYSSDSTFYVVVTDNNCASPITVNPVAEIKVYNEFTLTAGSDATYCHNSSPVTELEAVAAGGAGDYSYQWQTYDGTTWVDVPGNGTNDTYTPSVATVGTFRYHAVVTDGQCGTLTSNEVTITVNPLPTITATPATQTITSVKSNDNKDVYVVFSLKSKPSVKSALTIATGEGWKYTSFKVGPEEQTVGSGYCSYYVEDWAPRGSEEEKFDDAAIEIDPASDPNGNFRYVHYNGRYDARLYVYRSEPVPGVYNLRFRLKSNHDVGCTMKITIKPE